ncbi:MAG: exopolysaccharide biosynthesis protein, partial [Devosia nanyangense]|nr:exopolysaccharide biosynthesis protein [Devosia nanyangense]
MFAANLPTPSADDFWSALRELRPNQSRLEDNRLIPTAQADAAHVPIDMLRTRVAAMMEEKGWKTLAVTSPTAGCGKTT